MEHLVLYGPPQFEGQQQGELQLGHRHRGSFHIEGAPLLPLPGTWIVIDFLAPWCDARKALDGHLRRREENVDVGWRDNGSGLKSRSVLDGYCRHCHVGDSFPKA